MIRKQEELSVAYNEHMRGGDGTVIVKKFIRGPEDLCGKGRLLAGRSVRQGPSLRKYYTESGMRDRLSRSRGRV